MAGSLTDYAENKVLEWLFRANYTAPANLYFGLWTTTLTDASTGSSGTEVTGGSYARVSVARGTGAFDAAASGATANTSAITWPQATADWGTITHVGVCDASSAGNMIVWFDLTQAKTINNGDTFTIAAGDFDVTAS